MESHEVDNIDSINDGFSYSNLYGDLDLDANLFNEFDTDNQSNVDAHIYMDSDTDPDTNLYGHARGPEKIRQ